jgi:hypothetical protein
VGVIFDDVGFRIGSILFPCSFRHITYY